MKRFTIAFTMGLAVSACGPKEDITPQIEVSQNAPGRIAMFRRGANALPIGQRGEAGAPAATPAYARELADTGGFTGASASAHAGDLVLGNGEIALALRAAAGGPLSIVDAADARDREDGIAGLVPAAIVKGDGTAVPLVIDRARGYATEDGAATIVTSGHADAIRVTTTFKLEKPDRAVLVTTTLENPGDAAIGPLDVRDEIAWGVARAFAPGQAGQASASGASTGPDAPRELSGPYIGAVGPRVSYAETSTTGEVDATVTAKDARVHLDRALTLAPRSQKTFDRVIVLGTRPDTSSVVAELVRASSGDLGALTIRSADAPAGDMGRAPGLSAPVAERPRAAPPLVVIRTPAGDDALTIALDPRANETIADLPPGRFTARYVGQDPGRGVAFAVHKDQVTEISLPPPR